MTERNRIFDKNSISGLPGAGTVWSKVFVLGESRLRHWLTPALELEGGHIGCAIRPAQQRRGYGTRILALTLEKARGRGLQRVLVTCDKDNTASARIIEKNGGRLAGEALSEGSGKPVLRYWIELSEQPGQT